MIRVGEVIHGRYEVQQRVGMGGMADVYKAMDRKLNRYVAIKVLKAEFCSDKSFVAKFQAEARAAAGLSHPNIVSVYDVAEEAGAYFIVMELIDGITLKQYIEKKGKLSIKEATSIAIQVSTGIEAAHQNSIIHRDIKPQNIIISKDGKVKIADFGIAKAISANTNTISTNVMGSVHYSSPEQSRGGYLDAKSDIYSLGIVMFEMVTGRVPFDGDTTVAVAIQHLQEDIPSPTTFAPEVPISLEKIILKCTAKSPSNRYAKAGLLITDLKQSLITPDADFVDMEEGNGIKKTAVISMDEMAQIKNETGRVIGRKTNNSVNVGDNDMRDMNRKNKRNRSYDMDDDISPKSEKIMGIITIVAAVAIIIVIIMIIIKIGDFNNKSSVSKKHNNDNIEIEKNDNTEAENSEDDESTTDNELQENDEENTERNKNTEQDGSDAVSEEFMIPNKIGNNINEAVSELEAKGLRVIKKEDNQKVGIPLTVINQNPVDKMVVQGDTVELTYIAEKEKITIPAGLENMGEQEVSNTLTEIGFVVKTEFKYHDEIEAGNVISTSPSGGSPLEKGGTVNLVVSKGKEELKMPKLLSMKQKDAIKKIKELGLVIGNVTENVSDKYKKGMVMQQSIQPNALYKKGDSIDIVISAGVQDVQENFTWLWIGTINEPDDYTGREVKIVMEQTDGANIQSKNLFEGKNFNFEGHKFKEEALIPGVDKGKIYVYEKNSSGSYDLLDVSEIRFKALS